MFWCETIRHGTRFCSCEGVWTDFKIINANVNCTGLLEIYFTPEDGNRCSILKMRSGEAIPSASATEFKFKPHQHVKIEVYGGEITIVGNAYDGTIPKRNYNRFPNECPFGDVETWRERNIKDKTIENTNLKLSDEELQKKLETEAKKNLN